MSIGIIIQARMGSQRLPGKIMRPIAGRPLLSHVFGRLENLQYPVTVVIASSVEPANDQVEGFCHEQGVNCFRGSEDDVLARYYECATQYGFDHIVRLTADNPFTDIAELDRLIEAHLAEGNDYTHSFDDLPIGLGAEIFTFTALKSSFLEGHEPHHREHVNEFMLENPDRFKTGYLQVPAEKVCADLRLTVDTEEDYRRACYVAETTGGKWITTENAIEACMHFA